MEYKEAIRHLTELAQVFNLEYDQYVAVKKAIEIFKSQIEKEPKEPVRTKQIYAVDLQIKYMDGSCPVCERSVTRVGYENDVEDCPQYCDSCGTAFNWDNLAWKPVEDMNTI